MDMTNQQQQGQGQPPGNSPLSLLVNAVDSRDGARGSSEAASAPGAGSFQDRNNSTESVLRRGLGDSGGMQGGIEELLRQKQAESLRQQAAALQQHNPGANLLQQLSESQHLTQQLSQQLSQSDIRSALANAQLRQAPQLSNADIMALARSGALPGLSGLLGGGSLAGLSSAVGGGGYDSRGLGNLDLHSLEELERRQRLLSGMSETNPLLGQQQQQLQQQQQQQSQASAEPSRRESEAHPTASQISSSPAAMGAVRSNFSGDAAANVKAPPVAGADKKEQRRDPGSVVVPCRARGMPMDHNFKTAYFVIPENVRHGEELICSYFACRNAGVKFRYCSHCKVPVAKRNFRKRHRHGDNDKSKGLDDDDNSLEEGSASTEDNADADMDDIPTQVTAKFGSQETAKPANKDMPQPSAFQNSSQAATQQQMLNAQVAAQLASQEAAKFQGQQQVQALSTLTSHVSSTGGNMAENLQLGNLMNGAQNALDVLARGAAEGNSGLGQGLTNFPLGLLAKSPASAGSAGAKVPTGEERRKIIESRKHKWLELLADRPYTTDGDTMSAWLMEVLTLSDLTMPLNDNANSSDAIRKSNDKSDGSSSNINSANMKKEINEYEEDDGDDDNEDDEENRRGENGEDDSDDDNQSEDGMGADEDKAKDSDGKKNKDDDMKVKKEEEPTGAKESSNKDGESVKDASETKKRSLDEESNNEEPNPDSALESGPNPDSALESGYSVSFAEWRDRKKQKKVQAKKAPSE